MAEIGEESGQPGGSLVGLEEGKQRVERGLFIGVVRGRNGRPLTRVEGGINRGGLGLRRE
jgi:hypothetical protein